MDSDGYPEQEDFDELAKLDSMTEKDAFALLEKKFNHCGSGRTKKYKTFSDYPRNKIIDVIEVHLGGWSGCEAMMEYIQTNCHIFWIMYWYSEIVGGHYVFHGG